MATYYFLEDTFANGQLFLAGTSASTADVGGPLPEFWVPHPNVDPMDNAAAFAYQALGPTTRGQIVQQWTQFPINQPKWHWVGLTLVGPSPITPVFQLTTEARIPLTTEGGSPLVTP